jgi:hypothetical protein
MRLLIALFASYKGKKNPLKQIALIGTQKIKQSIFYRIIKKKRSYKSYKSIVQSTKSKLIIHAFGVTTSSITRITPCD